MNKKMAESTLLATVEAVDQPHHGVQNKGKLSGYEKRSALSSNQ